MQFHFSAIHQIDTFDRNRFHLATCFDRIRPNSRPSFLESRLPLYIPSGNFELGHSSDIRLSSSGGSYAQQFVSAPSLSLVLLYSPNEILPYHTPLKQPQPRVDWNLNQFFLHEYALPAQISGQCQSLHLLPYWTGQPAFKPSQQSMASLHTSRDIPLYGSSPINGPAMLRTGSESPMSSYGDADELMETDKEDEMTDEVDRSFSQTLSVSDGPDLMGSLQQPRDNASTNAKHDDTFARNKRHGMTLTRRIPTMLHGNDDDDPDEDEEVETTGYFGGMGPISPTGGGRSKGRPSIGQSTRLAFDAGKSKPVQSSSRLGQLQRPSAFSMLGKPAASSGERPQQRAFGRESGRENMLSMTSKAGTQGRSTLKVQGRSLGDGFIRGPATAPLRDMAGGFSDAENDDVTVKQSVNKVRLPMPLFRMDQRPSPKRGDVSVLTTIYDHHSCANWYSCSPHLWSATRRPLPLGWPSKGMPSLSPMTFAWNLILPAALVLLELLAR